MPRRCEWIERIPQALDHLEATAIPVVDRAGLEVLLRLSPRQALRVLTGFPASYAAGKSRLIGRADLISGLRAVLAGDDVDRERRRHERVCETLERSRRELRARRTPITGAVAVRDRRLSDLSPAIQLQPGELRIAFSGTEELLRCLFELSQAIMSDYLGFQQIVEPGHLDMSTVAR